MTARTPKGHGRPIHYQDPEVAASYGRRYSGGLARWKHERKAARIGLWLTPARSVLEVACGPGRFVEQVAGKSYVGVDLSGEMLAAYRSRVSGACLVRADASRLPFADASFDAVLCTRFLSHLRDGFRAQVLSEMVRVTRRHVILDGRHRYNLRFASRWLRRRLGLHHADKLRHTYGMFRRELREAGLEIREMRSIAWGLSARFILLAEKV